MGIKPIKIILLCLPAIGFFSCQEEGTFVSVREAGTMSISLSVPSKADNDYITYAMPGDEAKIEHIAVLAFKTDPADPSNVAKGTFLYKALASYNRPNPTNCVVQVKEMADAQTFVVIANARTIVDNINLAEGETKASVIQKLLMSQNTAFDAATMTSIPMWGEVQNKIVNNGVVPAGLNCKLYRMLAKINVKVDAMIPTTKFELRTVHLYMPRQKGTLIPDNWGAYVGTIAGEPTEAVTTPTQPTVAGTTPARATKYSYTTTTNKVENIYTFEAKNVATPALNMLDQTSLVVGGYYNNDQSKQYYYRVDFKSGTTQLDILRNFIYNVTITNVGGIGVENPDDAYKGLSVIEASIEPWNQATGDVQIGQTHLYVSNRYPWLKLDGVNETYPDSEVLKIKTSDSGGWTWKNEPTTNATLAAFGVTTTGGAANTEVSVNWTPADISTTMPQGRDGKAIIVSGNLEYTIHFMQGDCGRSGIPLPRKIGAGTYKTHRYPTGTGGAYECWMVENSREGTGSSKGYGLDWNGVNIGTISFDGNPSYRGKTNGYYYTWTQANTANNACPAGWSLPTENQWENLTNNINTNLNTSPTSIWWAGTRSEVAAHAFAGYSYDNGTGWERWGDRGLWWTQSAYISYKSKPEKMDGREQTATAATKWFSVRCV